MVCIGAAELLHRGSAGAGSSCLCLWARGFGWSQITTSPLWSDFMSPYSLFVTFVSSAKQKKVILILKYPPPPSPISLHPLPTVYHYFEDKWSDPPLSLWKRFFPPPPVGWCDNKPIKRGRQNKATVHQEKKRRRGMRAYCLDSDGDIYTCGIFLFALFRHLTSQGSLASSSLWRSPVTGSKTNFSSCRLSTTGNDYPTVNTVGFLEMNRRGVFCPVPLRVASCASYMLCLRNPNQECALMNAKRTTKIANFYFSLLFPKSKGGVR